MASGRGVTAGRGVVADRVVGLVGEGARPGRLVLANVVPWGFSSDRTMIVRWVPLASGTVVVVTTGAGTIVGVSAVRLVGAGNEPSVGRLVAVGRGGSSLTAPVCAGSVLTVCDGTSLGW